jgi:hypothetical protein
MTFLVSPNSNIIVDEWCGLNLSDAVYGKVADCFEHGNEYSASIRYWEILDYMRKY